MTNKRVAYWNRMYRRCYERLEADCGFVDWDFRTMAIVAPLWLAAFRRLSVLARNERRASK